MSSRTLAVLLSILARVSGAPTANDSPSTVALASAPVYKDGMNPPPPPAGVYDSVVVLVPFENNIEVCPPPSIMPHLLPTAMAGSKHGAANGAWEGGRSARRQTFPESVQ